MQAKKKMQTGGSTTVIKNKKGTTTRKKTSGGTTAVLEHENDKGRTRKFFGDADKTGVIYENYNTGAMTGVVKNKALNKKVTTYQKHEFAPIYKKTTKLKKK